MCIAVVVLASAMPSAAQTNDQDQPEHQHDMMHMDMNVGWQFMHDGNLFLEFNHQGGPRGGDEFVAPNWWMGMATRQWSHGKVTLASMLSLDPATVGKDGYREIFQSGESLNGEPLIDRQHPHDLFMQLAAAWRIPISSTTGVTIAGGPVGEPALGPVAFMHRASAADNPTAPIGHHLFDSTHVSFGVVSVGLDHGPWALEASAFNGREPDEDRWDFDFGPLDSFAARLWIVPRPSLAFQISRGHLTSPEALEPGNIDRTTVSGAWTRTMAGGVTSIGAGFGRNDTDHGPRSGLYVEGARVGGRAGVYARLETLQVETSLLAPASATIGASAIEDGLAHTLQTNEPERRDVVTAATIGGTHRIFNGLGFEASLGGDLTFYVVPVALESAYGTHPVSAHIFVRIRPTAGASRMWNMRMMGSGM